MAICLTTGCLVPDVEQFEPIEGATNRCSSDSDCAGEECDLQRGMCIAQTSEIGVVLLQIEPPAADRGFGGRVFFERVDNVSTRETPVDIELVEPADVVGEIFLVQPEADCRTRPVEIRLVPVERYLGLDATIYRGGSSVDLDPEEANLKLVPSILRNAYRLEGIPEGEYDVYVWENEPPPGGCEIAPQLQRSVDLGTTEGEGTLRSLAISQTSLPPTKLSVRIPWRAELFGWSLSVVHPVTSELMSTRAQLTGPRLTDGAAASAQLFAEEDLWLAQVGTFDYATQDQLLLQLDPPEGVLRPSISLSLGVLLAGAEDQAVAAVSDLRSFEDLVQLRSWAWHAGQRQSPVAGTVRFDATQLADISPSIRARLSVTVPILEEGAVEAQLPPGIYDATVFPEPPLELGDVGRLASIRRPVEVFVSSGGGSVSIVQSGSVLEVPLAPVVSGQLSLRYGTGDPTGFNVQAVGIQPSVLERAARASVRASEGTARLTADARGRFNLPVPDCGACDAESPARYDLRVVPPPSSGLPWTVVPGVEVFEDVSLGDLTIAVPARVAGVLTFRTIATQDARAFPGALIRAYALLDSSDELVTDPLTPYCRELRTLGTGSENCIARAVQIGQTRSVEGGQFELLLPTQLN